VTAALAGFIASPDGALYGRYCEAYGEHPGDIFSDDVMRFQVGMAYLMKRHHDQPEALDDTPGIVTDLDAQIRAMR
jgi:hypothetical protein